MRRSAGSKSRARRLLTLVACWLLLAPLAHAYTIEEIARADALLALMDQRLRISDQVARAKWNSGAPIEDFEREKAVKAAFVTEGMRRGGDALVMGPFMEAQIEASKVRQRELFRRWRDERQPPFSDAPDLAKEIRPRLDDLSGKLLATLLVAPNAPLLRWRAEVLWGTTPDVARQRALQGWL